MITRVSVKNFRSLADVNVELGPLTVLVGRNGAGKSTFVDVLRFVRDALRFGLDSAITKRYGIGSIRHRSSRYGSNEIEISLTAEESRFWGKYSFILGFEQSGSYRVKREFFRAGETEGLAETLLETEEGKWKVFPLNSLANSERNVFGGHFDLTSSLTLSLMRVLAVPRFAQMHWILTRSYFYHIFPNSLREPQMPLNELPLMENGENLATVIKQLKRESDWFPDLLAALNKIVGDVTDIRVRPIGGYLVTELKHEQTNGRSTWLALAQESDGTLRILGLLAGMYHYIQRILIAVEEPELTLHPGALGVLSDVLREASQRSQILITTQSPDLISRFGADELRVVERVNGATHIGPIDETQREVINDQLFSAGDLLRIEGLHRAPIEVAGGGNA